VETKRLNSSGEMADPCGTPVRTAWQTDVTSRYLQDADRPRRYATSHLTILWGRVELLTACSSLVWFTVSKAFEKSMAISTVRSGGLGWLNPVATL